MVNEIFRCNKVSFTPPRPVTRPFLPNPTPPNASFQSQVLAQSGGWIGQGLVGSGPENGGFFGTLKKSPFYMFFFSIKVVVVKVYVFIHEYVKSCPMPMFVAIVNLMLISLIPWFPGLCFWKWKLLLRNLAPTPIFFWRDWPKKPTPFRSHHLRKGYLDLDVPLLCNWIDHNSTTCKWRISNRPFQTFFKPRTDSRRKPPPFCASVTRPGSFRGASNLRKFRSPKKTGPGFFWGGTKTRGKNGF